MSKFLLTCLIICVFLYNSELYAQSEDTTPAQSCLQRAQWMDPDDQSLLDGTSLLKKAATSPVVLLGEQHENAEHHRWQYQTMVQLYAHNPNMVIGFEMFPRRLQPVLDSWGRGDLSPDAFLKESDWNQVWGYDADLYMPLFEFARMNRLPMIALNVERDLISEVGDKGWAAVDEDIKEGVTKPRPAPEAYLDILRGVFKHHPSASDDALSDEEKEKEFTNFSEAQLTWDAAMAQKIAATVQSGGSPLVVGIMGAGHVRYGHGVPHQLAGQNIKSTLLLPWSLDQSCDDMKTGIADAVFGVEADIPPVETFRPLLGVRIAPTEDALGVLIEQTVEESVAEDAGLLKEDIIKRAAGLFLASPQDLISVVRRQAPGTWLPLEIERNGETLEIIAKFPTAPNS